MTKIKSNQKCKIISFRNKKKHWLYFNQYRIHLCVHDISLTIYNDELEYPEILNRFQLKYRFTDQQVSDYYWITGTTELDNMPF